VSNKFLRIYQKYQNRLISDRVIQKVESGRFLGHSVVCFLSTRLIMVEKYREMGRKTTIYYHDWFGIEPLYVVESSGTSPVDPHFCRQPAAVMVKHASGHSICRGAHDGHSARRAADRRPLKSSICCQINRNALMRLSSFCSVVHIQ